MKALVLLAVLWGLIGCATVSSMPMAPSEAPSTYEASRLHRHWMERESREKPRRSDRKEHVSDRGKHPSTCDSAPGGGGHRGTSSKGQKSKRS
jgi:hypothetical protein